MRDEWLNDFLVREREIFDSVENEKICATFSKYESS